MVLNFNSVPKVFCVKAALLAKRAAACDKQPPPPPHFRDPVSPNQPETLARISGFLRVAIKKTIFVKGVCVVVINATVSFVSEEIHLSMYYAEHFVLRNFRLFLHCCLLHVWPWLFGMQLATVCVSRYGSVYSICTHQPKAS